MSFEMSCANCQGRLMVETLGIVVACPHCGTHLAIPAEIPGLSDIPKFDASDEDDDDADENSSQGNKSTWAPGFHVEDSPSSFPDFSRKSGTANDAATSESNVLVSEPEVKGESEVPSAIRVVNPDLSAVIPVIVTDVKVSEPVSGFPVLGESKEETPAEDLPKTKEQAQDKSANAASVSEPKSAEPKSAEPTPAIVANSQPAAKPVTQETQPPPPRAKNNQNESPKQSVYDSVFSSRRGKLIPHPVFQAWVSYTILLTAGLAMAIYYIFTAPTSNLESLPDVKPVEKSGKVVRRLVPEKAVMPPGHTLALNKTQRFGNIEVTPLKVTKGNLELVGREYVEDSRKFQEAGKVLKLWLKFKNVSRDQIIAPLDNELLFFRDPRADRKAGALANQFLCPAEEKSEQGNVVLVYDHWVDGDYDMKGQNLGKELKPGEEITIYIPTDDEGWNTLQGPLIWRVHIRKGYSPKNYGVTTIFEVKFHSDAIESESSNA